MLEPNTYMFDTEGFSVDLMPGGGMGGRGGAFVLTYTFFLQVRRRLC